jgi:hypothetical protein
MVLSIDFSKDRALKTIAAAQQLAPIWIWQDKTTAALQGVLAQLGRSLEDLSEAWYADATRAFPTGTPEGDTLRSTIPTTYTPPPDKPATPPAPPANPQG